MQRTRSVPWLGFALAVVACKSDAAAPAEQPSEAPRLAGVPPERFDCASIASPAAIGELIAPAGATVRAIEAGSPAAPGVARQCTYEVQTTPPEQWMFDFDCRDGMRKTAELLFTQYRQDSTARVARYQERPDAGVARAGDAGTESAPVAAVDVAVGEKGLDHHGNGILFIDDDAPCYARVVGPDAARRLALARLVARNLTFANAPMKPRPFK